MLYLFWFIKVQLAGQILWNAQRIAAKYEVWIATYTSGYTFGQLSLNLKNLRGTMEPHYTFTWMFEIGQVTSGRFGLHEAPISHHVTTIFCGSGRKKRLYTKKSQNHDLNWELQSRKSFKRYLTSS